MDSPHIRTAPLNECTVDAGIDDIILSYSSNYWIAPHLDDAVQQWDIGMHLAEEGPGPQFGSIRLHLVDHNRCLDPIAALDALSQDLYTIGQALFDPTLPGVRQDLWDRLSCPGNTLIVDSVTIDRRLRGHGLGVFLTGMALDYFTSGTGVVALFSPSASASISTPAGSRMEADGNNSSNRTGSPHSHLRPTTDPPTGAAAASHPLTQFGTSRQQADNREEAPPFLRGPGRRLLAHTTPPEPAPRTRLSSSELGPSTDKQHAEPPAPDTTSAHDADASQRPALPSRSRLVCQSAMGGRTCGSCSSAGGVLPSRTRAAASRFMWPVLRIMSPSR
jgi:hypothetical protein